MANDNKQGMNQGNREQNPQRSPGQGGQGQQSPGQQTPGRVGQEGGQSPKRDEKRDTERR